MVSTEELFLVQMVIMRGFSFVFASSMAAFRFFLFNLGVLGLDSSAGLYRNVFSWTFNGSSHLPHFLLCGDKDFLIWRDGMYRRRKNPYRDCESHLSAYKCL